MSFYGNLSSKLDELDLGSDKKEREYSGHRDYPPPSQQYGGQYGGSRSPAPPSPGYQGSYSSPPPASQGPVYSPPPDKPKIPEGWVPQFDQQHQRWYYYEVATGRSQWTAPGYNERGWGSHGESGHSSHDALGYGSSHHDSHGYDSHGDYGTHEEEKKKKDHSGLLMGVAGGLAVGAIGGALLADWKDDHEREEEEAEHAANRVQSQSQYYPPQPVYEPAYNDEGEYVSASDRESVASAREDYEEALAEARDSDASSSEEEEVEEAREEYEEEYEEAYDD
ncbi:hypothetical protein GGR54DRAFT_640541 [Hypoxylon sp. NC1633]|nr:hypothetical protein GGR54DRAFT_640541 [Hypoxylon sp. NC1633]